MPISWFTYHLYSLYSPLHIQAILRWHVAPGLLKSHAAQVVSSTIADGCKRFVKMMLGYIAPETVNKPFFLTFTFLLTLTELRPELFNAVSFNDSDQLQYQIHVIFLIHATHISSPHHHSKKWSIIKTTLHMFILSSKIAAVFTYTISVCIISQDILHSQLILYN